jgi:hypothetical protein
MKKNNTPLYFSTLSYPTFGRGIYSDDNPPSSVTDSPYYWWFKFLQLNADYKQTFKNKGKGKCEDLYKDFGDIYKVNFKDWWREHAFLFAEPKNKYGMRIANSTDELAPFNSSEVVNLVVPLNWNHRSLKKYFNSVILKKVPKSKQGINVETSKAEYKISGRWRVDALEAAYKVYILRINEKMYWADIAIKAGLNIAKGLKIGEKVDINSDQRRDATTTAIRHFHRAEVFIKSSITKSFPY